MRVLGAGAAVQGRRSLMDVYDHIASECQGPSMPVTLQGWQRLATELRDRIRNTLGVVPDRPRQPVVDVVGRSYRDTHAVERLAITTRPGLVVTANLYLPTDPAGPAPALLCPHGHLDGGKAAEAYQRFYLGLVTRGFVVLAPDAIGYGERADLGHREVASPSLIGTSLIGMEIWDNLQCLDILSAREEVDPRRIGCAGNSGGGSQTMWTAAIDERIAAAAVAGHSGTFAYIHAKERVLCTCALAPQLVPHIELHHVLGLVAPRPLLLLGGKQDHFFPWDLQTRTRRMTHRIYDLFSAGDALEQFITNDGHPLSQPKREAAYRFFLRRLYGHDGEAAAEQAREHGSVGVLAPSDPVLCCYPDETTRPPELRQSLEVLIQREARQILSTWTPAASAEEWAAFRDQRTERLRALLLHDPKATGLPRVPRVPVTDPIHTQNAAGQAPGVLEGVVLWSDQWTPLAAVLREAPGTTSVRIIIDSNGKDSAWVMTAMAEAKELAWLAVDLRGWGELAPHELSPDGLADEQVAWQQGLGYDVPLFGLRAKDLLATIEWATMTWPDRTIELVGRGFGAWVVLVGGIPHDAVTRVELHDLPASFFPAPDEVSSRGPATFANVPDLVRDVGDVPHLIGLLAPTPCRIMSLMDSTAFLDPDTGLDLARQCYQAAGTPGALYIAPSLTLIRQQERSSA